MHFELLALDIDGTLNHPGAPDHPVSPRVADAVHAAADAGLEIVLCTGRRFRTCEPVLAQLDLQGEVVIHNGVLVKDIASAETLRASYLPGDVFAEALSIMRSVGPPLVYVDRYAEGLDMLSEPIEHLHPFQCEYATDHAAHLCQRESLGDQAPSDTVMMSLMAEGERLLAVREALEARLGSRVATNFVENKSYRGHILEVVRPGVSKWSALAALAEMRGVPPARILAIGDDRNDAAMLAGAGTGVAMGNAVDEVKAVADWVAPPNDQDGAAVAIDRYVLSPRS